jgi:amidase/aspartyl-tRNA(Asn)/glutamyl-tRNA(Gln) amidotransferase subunit A
MSFNTSLAPLSRAPELCKLSAAELIAQFRSGEISPVEVTQSVLEHAQEVQARFNAFTLIDHQGALDLAKASEKRWSQGAPLSPIDGVPTTIKDLIWFKDRAIRYGSLTSASEPCAEDAPCVRNLRANGAVFIGVTTSPEMGWKAVTDSKAFGITRNPWHPEMTAGGSSGGAAVAAATGAGVLHVGTDGGGSIRIPASFCGIVGHKPTFGVVPAFPSSAFGTVAHVGPMARNVEDVATMLSAMAGRDLRDWTQGYQTVGDFQLKDAQLAKARIGYWSTPPGGHLDPDVSRAMNVAIDRLRSAGASVEPISLPEEDVHAVFQAHWFAGAANRLSHIAAQRHPDMDEGLVHVSQRGARMSAPELVAYQVRRANFGAAMDRLLSQLDVLISPAVSVLPFQAGLEVPSGSGLERWTQWAGFSYPLNLSQQPACVIPCASKRLDSGGHLPIGLQIIGARGADTQVLSIARAIERMGLEQIFI